MAKSCLRSLWMLPKDNSFENNLNINGLENLLLKWGKNWLELVLDAYCFREFDGFYAVNDFSDKFPTVAKTTVLIGGGLTTLLQWEQPKLVQMKASGIWNFQFKRNCLFYIDHARHKK